MNKSTNKIIIFIIVAFIIVIGGIVCKAKGFNIELEYSPRNQIIISNNNQLNQNVFLESINVYGKLENKILNLLKEDIYGGE